MASIAVGYAVADALVKAAAVTLHEVAAVSPGKLCILYSGGVAELEVAHTEGLRRAGSDLIDDLLLARIDPQVMPLLTGRGQAHPADALGVLECPTVAAGLLAADAAAKTAEITLLELRRAKGIGGKTVILLSGTLSAVEAALEAGTQSGSRGRYEVRPVAIPSLHDDLRRFLLAEWGIPVGVEGPPV